MCHTLCIPCHLIDWYVTDVAQLHQLTNYVDSALTESPVQPREHDREHDGHPQCHAMCYAW